MPRLTSYLSVIDYLNELYRYRKIKDAGFSYERWASELGYNSRSFMKMIVSQKRRMTSDFISAFSAKMEFSLEENQYFSLLVSHVQAKTEQEKELFLNKIFEYRGKMQRTLIVSDADEFLLNPFLTQLQVLLSFLDIKRTPECLASLLKIDAEKCLDLLETLERLGLAQRTENSQSWKPAENSFVVPQKPGSAALTAYHNQAALEAIQAQSMAVDLRKFKSILLPLSEKDFKEFYIEIEATLSRLLAKYDKDYFSQCRLYKVNFNAYPVTEIHRDSIPIAAAFVADTSSQI